MKNLLANKPLTERIFQITIANLALFGISISLIIIALIRMNQDNDFKAGDTYNEVRYEYVVKKNTVAKDTERTKTELFDKSQTYEESDEIFALKFISPDGPDFGLDELFTVETSDEKVSANLALDYAVYALSIKPHKLGFNATFRRGADVYFLKNVKVEEKDQENQWVEFKIEFLIIGSNNGDPVDQTVWYLVRVEQKPDNQTFIFNIKFAGDYCCE